MKHVREHWDRIAGWGAIALGALVLLLGWIGVSGTAFPAEQLPFILSGGIGGLFLLGLGAVLLLSADLRDEWIKLDRIEQRLESDAAERDRSVGAQPGVGAVTIPAEGVSTNGRSARRVADEPHVVSSISRGR